MSNQLICKICQKTFTPLRSDTLYCSDACRRQKMREAASERAKGPVERHCAECGKLYASRIGRSRFCSGICLDRHRKRDKAREKAIAFNLEVCPFLSGLVRLEGERMPDLAWGF